MSTEQLTEIRTGRYMKRVARTVIISAVVITAVTAALAVAETGRYPGAKQIPTVQSSQRPSATTVSTPPVAAAAPVAVATPAAPSAKAAKPKTKTKSGSGSGSSTKNTVTKKPAPAPKVTVKQVEDTHKSEREVVSRKVRDESDSHQSDHKSSD
jgi:hypothetical protein